MRLTVGDETRSGRMIDATVRNGRFLGGGMTMCPDAEPDDGLFDVLLIGDVTKRDLAFVLPKIYKGKHLPHPRLELLRGSVVTVDVDEPLPIELDGEQPGTTRPVRGATARPATPGSGSRLGGRLARSGCLGLLQRGQLLLELRDAPLELVDPTHLLREVVDPRPQVVYPEDLLPPGKSAMRWSASCRVREPRHEVLIGLRLLCRRCRHRDSHSTRGLAALVRAHRRRPRGSHRRPHRP